MKKKFLLLSVCCMLSACVSEQERQASLYMYEEALLNQCSHTLGFQKGTTGYMNCRLFYNSYFKTMGYDMSYPNYSKASKVQNLIDTRNYQCVLFWGGNDIETMNKSDLWSCINQISQQEMDEVKHKKELEEQKKVLTDSIAEGQTKANENAVLQERISAERERVARETGKSPGKINCKTYTKSNGYVQIKCK